jgi:hypothetical protein
MNVESLWKEAILPFVRILSWHLSGRFDGIRKAFQPVCGPRFAPRTTQIWCRVLTSRPRPLVVPWKCRDIYILGMKNTSVSITSIAKEIRTLDHEVYRCAHYFSYCYKNILRPYILVCEVDLYGSNALRNGISCLQFIMIHPSILRIVTG